MKGKEKSVSKRMNYSKKVFLSIFLIILSFFFQNPSLKTRISLPSSLFARADEDIPIIITNHTTVNDGTYLLAAKDGSTTLTLTHFSNNAQDFYDISLSFSFKQNVSLLLSFSTAFQGKEHLNENGLEILSFPVTINSSKFENWTIKTVYYPPGILKRSVRFYYVTSHNFTQLSTGTGGFTVDEFVELNTYLGNGTYVLLGEPGTPAFWQSPWFIIGIGLFTLQALVLLGVGYLIWQSIFKRNNNRV